jgi:hypothetical protein
VGVLLAEQCRLRFVVGTFDSWPQLREALRDARARGLVLDSFNCLALERVLAGTTIVAPSQEPVAVQALRFSDNADLIACTCGPLADRLLERLNAGAHSLQDALGHWLVPRHAAHFVDAVEAGKVLFWIRVADVGDERRAYRSLLAHSAGAVGVHDLALPGE